MVSRADNPSPKIIENGVVVPPGLQVNEMTLAEHDWLCRWDKGRGLDRDEAILAGHNPEAVELLFGSGR